MPARAPGRTDATIRAGLGRGIGDACFRDLVDGVDAGIYVVGDNGRLLYANPAFAAMLGYDSAAQIQSAFTQWSFVAPHDRERLAAYHRERVSGGSPPAQYEYDALRRDGTIVKLENRVRALCWLGEPATQGTVIDITARKRAERALIESQRWNKAIARRFQTVEGEMARLNRRSLETVLLIRDITIAANTAHAPEVALQATLDRICRYTGWPAGHAYLASGEAGTGLVPAGLWHVPDPRRYAALRAALDTAPLERGQCLPGRVLAAAKPASEPQPGADAARPGCEQLEREGIESAIAFPVLIGEEVGAVLEFFSREPCEPDDEMIGIMRQIGLQLGRNFERQKAGAERERMEAELHLAHKLESVGQLAAGIAHEINTPTQYVGDNVHFLRDAITDLLAVQQAHEELLSAAEAAGLEAGLCARIRALSDERDVAYLLEEIPGAIEQAQEGTRRIAEIVAAMKEFSHPGGEAKEPVDLNRAMETTATVARNEWKYVADLETDLDESLPLVSGFPAELGQVFLNLIVNAAHAIGDVVGDGAEHKGRIAISTRALNDAVEVRVSDTGAGMDEQVRAKAFDPFFTTKGVGKGTGQGLAIARSVVVDKHGGSIDVETAPGQGTTFIIRLPVEAAEEMPA